MTDSTKTTEQSQQSSTSPWSNSLGLVNSLLSKYGSQSTDVTSGQSNALSNLQSASSSLPSFTDQATSAVNKIYNTDNSAQVGLLNNAYSTLQSNLGSTASGANLNPYSTPGFSDAINTMTGDITKSVKNTYAGSGRDPSGAGSFAGSLGRGLTQGIAPTIQSQYNTNYSNMSDANKTLSNAASTTASGINSLNTSQIQTLLSALTGSQSIPTIATQNANSQLSSANSAYSQPYSNLSQLLSPSVSLANLGSTSSGTSNATQTSSPSLLESVNSGFTTGGKGLSALSALLSLSDRNAKTDIRKVGKLLDGQDVYSFRYHGSPRTEIGLMAQDVEKRDPGAVVEIGGFKHVNYGRALAPAARVGALMAEAA